MPPRRSLIFALLCAAATLAAAQSVGVQSVGVPPVPTTPKKVFGFRDFTAQSKWDAAFLAVPDAKLAGQHLKILTAPPHWASSPEDKATADYVAAQFRAAGLATEIVPYRVLLNRPASIFIEAFDASGKKILSGPTPEHVDSGPYGSDPFQDDPRILPAFNGSSPSGDVTAQVVYANYGTTSDFLHLATLGISVKGKIVLVRYGSNFRGTKVYIAQRYGAAGVLIYSDPADDGYALGDIYPRGPYRPATGVQRGSVQFLPIYPGDAETPGIASTLALPDSARQLHPNPTNLPYIPSNPISYADATPILQALSGPAVPHDWQGALPFTYHLGGSPDVTVHMHLQQDYQRRIIWDVIGAIPGTDPTQRADLVIAGNHRDAWVYGAVDPSSGTAAMLEAVHGLGALLKQGWHPRRTILIASWDAEEEGLIGSTEWVEQHQSQLAHAVAYFNMDVGVEGPDFSASAVPSLKEFLRDVTRAVPSAKDSATTVYAQWLQHQSSPPEGNVSGARRPTPAHPATEVNIGTLGSGSDYTPFVQHAGIPSTDIESDGPYGVYHSVFDDYAWYTKFADPNFTYLQQQARVFGLEVLHMADTDVLPYDYRLYGREVQGYIEAAQRKALALNVHLDFSAALHAAGRLRRRGRLRLHPPAHRNNRHRLAQHLAPRRRAGHAQPRRPPSSSLVQTRHLRARRIHRIRRRRHPRSQRSHRQHIRRCTRSPPRAGADQYPRLCPRPRIRRPTDLPIACFNHI